jgi:hypothetical protein
MMSVFDPTLAVTLLTHPFQVALMVVTLGALVREGLRALVRNGKAVYGKAERFNVDMEVAA